MSTLTNVDMIILDANLAKDLLKSSKKYEDNRLVLSLLLDVFSLALLSIMPVKGSSLPASLLA